jgi:uncharacterized membrane protein
MSKSLICTCFVFVAALAASRAAKPPEAHAKQEYVAIPVPVPQSTDPRFVRGSTVVDLNSHGDVLAVSCLHEIWFDSAECTAVLWPMKSETYQELFPTCPVGVCNVSSAGVPLRLNERGDVGGRAGAGFVLWSQRLGTRVLGQGPPFSAYRPIVGFNDQGEIAGVDFTYPPAAYKAFFASEKTGIVYLTPASYSVPSAMNAAGEIVGWANFGPTGDFFDSRSAHAFYWSRRTTMVDIGALFGAETSNAIAINKQGTVVGTRSVASGPITMFLWQVNGGLVAEVDLPPSCGPSFLTSKDVVIGFCRSNNAGPTSIWTWGQKEGFRDMGSFGILGLAAANSEGQVAGTRQQTPADSTHVFVWSVDDGLVDLTTSASFATAISEDGVVGGYLAAGSNGKSQAVVWVRRKPRRLDKSLGQIGGAVQLGKQLHGKGAVAGIELGIRVRLHRDMCRDPRLEDFDHWLGDCFLGPRFEAERDFRALHCGNDQFFELHGTSAW